MTKDDNSFSRRELLAQAKRREAWRQCAHRADFASTAEHERDCPVHGVDVDDNAARAQTQTLYSRPIPFSEAQARTGDQVNTAIDGFSPYWQTFVDAMPCDNFLRREGDCDGSCALVVQVQPNEDYDATLLHVSRADLALLQTRLPVDVDR